MRARTHRRIGDVLTLALITIALVAISAGACPSRAAVEGQFEYTAIATQNVLEETYDVSYPVYAGLYQGGEHVGTRLSLGFSKESDNGIIPEAAIVFKTGRADMFAGIGWLRLEEKRWQEYYRAGASVSFARWDDTDFFVGAGLRYLKAGAPEADLSAYVSIGWRGL